MTCSSGWACPTKGLTRIMPAADPVQQRAFLAEFTDTLLAADERTAVVAFDEFSVCERPSASYGWAEKNTRPSFKTDEKIVVV